MVRFDYGTNCLRRRLLLPLPKECNQIAYGQDAPPVYNLSRITTPLALFTGGQDRLADPLDTEYLREALAPGIVVASHREADYEHLDFVWGLNAKDRVYPHVMRLLEQAL